MVISFAEMFNLFTSTFGIWYFSRLHKGCKLKSSSCSFVDSTPVVQDPSTNKIRSSNCSLFDKLYVC